MFSRIGSMLAPFLLTLSSYGEFIPIVVLGILALVEAALVCLLPETKDTVLPDTLDDIEGPMQ